MIGKVETWTAEELEEEKIHPVVRACMQINDSPVFDNLMLGCIVVNSVFMAMPYHGMPSLYESVLYYAETSFTIIFVVEFVIKILALGGDIYRYI